MVKNRNIPFGYCMVNGKYALNAPEAETVQEIFKKIHRRQVAKNNSGRNEDTV